ncbi:DUF6477 family protein [Bauldia litoralis]|uniref:Uncharacterized protein n=1 Tax=Bauldia litoralis TaxID=665467 RepID=A0A1G6CEA5_9HYPH|nr:DUF6477 family protein [Bauldia litoralis]SDB31151.1 hypothetical protein SAMN02982931_02372 [Bauldia litoralis]
MTSRNWPNLETGSRQDRKPSRLRDHAARSVARVIAAGTETYDRMRHLPRLIPMTCDQIADDTMETRRAILARLARALRAERSRGRAGHWTYDLNRHIGLRQAFEAERRRLGPGEAPPKTHPPPKGGG